MSYLRLSKGKFALVDDEDFEWLNQWKWHYPGHYARRRNYIGTRNGKRIFKDIYLHRLIARTPYGLETDHINGDKLDNRKSNLRIVSSSQNHINIGIRSNNTSGVTGIYFDKARKKWAVEISFNNKKVHIGRYDDIETAKKERRSAELRYFNYDI